MAAGTRRALLGTGIATATPPTPPRPRRGASPASWPAVSPARTAAAPLAPQTAIPSGYNIDVAGQNAASGTRIIEWRANRGDPGQDFAQVTAPNGGTYLAYVPFGSLAGAKAQSAGYARTHAEAAYSSDGTAKYCIGVAPNPGAGALLEPCGTQGKGLTLRRGVDPGHKEFYAAG